ncbi:unnamed protein product [Brassica rapa]|uniref:Uncharacterized protein n=1 Tax=Brassica campestris TaxID=3711 RepID=A0A8D9HUV9_BRACM|nr:unnamed protein product [Brassica rapa]
MYSWFVVWLVRTGINRIAYDVDITDSQLNLPDWSYFRIVLYPSELRFLPIVFHSDRVFLFPISELIEFLSVSVDRICGFVPLDSPLCDLFRSELIAFSFGSEFVCDSCSAFLSSWILLQLHSLLVDQRICFFKAIHQHLISSLTSASPFDSMASSYPPTLVQTCSLAKSFLSAFLCEATSKIKCEFSNGSLCRPPENYFTYCSWCSFSELVCVWLTHSVSRHLGSGTVYWCVAYRLQKVLEASFGHQNVYSQGEQRLASRMHSTFVYLVTHGSLDDTHAVRKMMCLSLNCTRVRELLLLLVSWFQQRDISFDSYCFLLIGLHHCGGLLSADSCYHKLIKLLITLQMQSSSTGLVLKQLKHYMLASPVLHLSAASGFLHFLKTDSSGSQAASTIHALQWEQSFPSLSIQGLNLAFAFIDHIIVAGSGWFKSILDLLYCSLPRPPEIP